MKRYIKSDVNSYSYTGGGFADDRITLAHYTDDNGYVELVKDLSTCYVTAQGFGYRNSYDYYCEYPMADIDGAIEDFNRCVQHFGGKRRLRRSAVEFELSKYGKSLDEYISSATNTCNIGAKPSYVSADSRYTYSQDDKVFTNGNMKSQVSVEHYGDGKERYTVTYWTVLENGEEYNAKTIMDTYYSPKYYYNLQSARRAAKKIIGLE